MITVATFLLACLAVAGYINFRDNSIPETAIDFSFSEIDGDFKVTGKTQLTHKTVQSERIGTTAGLAISGDDSGTIIPLNLNTKNTGIILPVATTGLNFTFVLTKNAGPDDSTTANDAVFISAGPNVSPSQFFWGTSKLIRQNKKVDDAAALAINVGPTDNANKYLLLLNNSTKTGGMRGERIYVECITDGSWCVQAIVTTRLAGNVDLDSLSLFNEDKTL